MTEANRSPLAVLPHVGVPMFLAVASQTMVAVALPLIGQEFNEFARLHWLIVGYVVALTISSPVYGVLGDRYGRGLMLLTSLWIFAIGSLLCFVAWNFEVLTMGRMVQGLGGGGLMSLSQALIGQLVTARETGRAQGYAASIGMAASTGGPLLAGVLAQFIGWRSMFALVILMAMVAAALLFKEKIPRLSNSHASFDLAGLMWLSAAIVAFTVAIELLRHPEHLVWAALGGGVTLLATLRLVRSQQGRDEALFPAALFSLKAIRYLSILVSGHGAALVTLTTMIPLFQTVTRGDTTLQVALTLLAMTLAVGFSGVLTGNLISLTGRSTLWPTLALPLTLIGLGALVVFGSNIGRVEMTGVYVLIGIGLGTVMPVVQTSIQFAAPSEARGSAASAVTFFRSIGAMAGTSTASLVLIAWITGAGNQFAGTVAVLAGPDALSTDALASWHSAFQAAFAVCFVFVAFMWLAAVRVPIRKLR